MRRACYELRFPQYSYFNLPKKEYKFDAAGCDEEKVNDRVGP